VPTIRHIPARQPTGHVPFITKNNSETDKFAILDLPIGSTRGVVGHDSFSEGFEKEERRFTPEGDFDEGQLPQPPRIAYTGRMRGGFADRLFPDKPASGARHDKLQDFTTWRSAALAGAAELKMRQQCQRRQGGKLPTV